MTKHLHQSRTEFPPESHRNAHLFDLDTTLCPGKRKP